ncbi:MAG: glycosyltransferase family 39 protein [Chrysiogenetes bacterium]|nr:glycosyltransferase family 39 protein [Chrysiogenetes bacterium]
MGSNKQKTDGATTGVKKWAPWALLALTLLVFSNGLTGDFVFDDFVSFEDAWLQHSITEWGWGKNEPLGQASMRPLVTGSFYLDFALFGQNPTGYHCFNLLLHLINVLLAWRLFRRLGVPDAWSLFAAAIFAVHPVQTESVVYVAGRRDLLQGLFYLGIFHLYLNWREAPSWPRGLVCGLLVFLGMNAKASLFPLPVVLLLYEASIAGRGWWDEGRNAPLARAMDALKSRTKLFAGLFALATPFLIYRAFFVTHVGTSIQSKWIGGSLDTHLMSAAKAQILLLWRLVFPLHLQADYSPRHWLYSSGFDDPLGWAALAIGAAYLIVMVRFLFTRPWIGFAMCVIALGLFPTCQIVRHRELTAERYLYIPMIGWGILAARAGEWFSRRDREDAASIAGSAAAVLIVLYGARAFVRNRVYDGPQKFWSAVLEGSPECARAIGNLAVFTWGDGDRERALAETIRATRLDPLNAGAFANVGVMMGYLGRTEEARENLARAVALEPEFPSYRADLAGAQLELGEIGPAMEQIAWIERNQPGNPRLPKLRKIARQVLQAQQAK